MTQLATFIRRFDLAALSPSDRWVKVANHQGDRSVGEIRGTVFGLAPTIPSSARSAIAEGAQFAAFIVGFAPGAVCTVDLSHEPSTEKQQCVAEFVDPSTGGVVGGTHVIKGQGSSAMALPAVQEKGGGVALRVICSAVRNEVALADLKEVVVGVGTEGLVVV
jgi:hypothetical protein